MLLESFGKAVGVYGQAFFGGQLFRQLQREAIGVVQAEGLLAADFGFGLIVRILLGHEFILAADAGDALVELLHAGGQRGFEPGGFLHDFVQNVGFLFHQQRIGFVVDLLDEDLAHFGQHGGFETQLTRVADGTAKQTAEDVSGAHVGGQDAVHVADQHGGGADMIRNDPHRLLRFGVLVIPESGLFFQMPDHRQEQVGLVAVSHAVQEGQHPIQAETGVHVFIGQRSVSVGILDVLHIHVVADFNIPAAAAGRPAVRAAGLIVAGVKPFVVRAAGGACGSFQFPPVVALGQIEDMIRQDADFLQQVCGFIISRRSVVAFKDGRADFLSVQAENLGQQVVAPPGLFLFKIVAQRPVAHHFEESEVGRVADAFDIHRADAALHVAQPFLSGGMFLAEQIGHQRLHTGHVEHDAGGAVADQRDGADIDMSPFFIEADPGVSEFLGGDHWTFLPCV